MHIKHTNLNNAINGYPSPHPPLAIRFTIMSMGCTIPYTKTHHKPFNTNFKFLCYQCTFTSAKTQTKIKFILSKSSHDSLLYTNILRTQELITWLHHVACAFEIDIFFVCAFYNERESQISELLIVITSKRFIVQWTKTNHFFNWVKTDHFWTK